MVEECTKLGCYLEQRGGLVIFGYNLVVMREWEHKAERWMKLVLGVLLVGFSIWLFY